jgi:cell division septal protein FtsQ
MIRRRRHAPRDQIQRALKRSRWRQILTWLAPRWIALLTAISCFTLTLVLLSSQSFIVEHVVVRRESASSHEAITRATELTHVVGQNIFLLHAQRVAQEVASVPSVLHAHVVPRLPNLIEIEIVERTPIAAWHTTGGIYLIDDQGYAIGEVSPEATATDLLIVKDTTGRDFGLGERVNQRSLLAARELVKALPAIGMTARDVEYSPQGVVLTTESGWRVIFGETDNLNAKLAGFAAIVEFARKENVKIAVLDLRPHERPYYQLAP